MTSQPVEATRPPLWRHRDFRPLWAAETVSQVGTQVTVLAIPLMAIQVLDATTFEIGALQAVEFAPFILVGLQAGAIVDRMRRRPVMMVCDIGRAVVLATLPLAHWLGWLTMAQLYLVVFVHGVMTVFFDVANMAILPAIVPRDQIADGNAKLEVSRSAAQVAGPGLGGFLVQAIGSVTAVVVDGLSFVLSALFLSRVHAREPKTERGASQPHPRIRDDVREGLGFVWHHPLLRPIALCTATSNLFGNIAMAVFVVYAVRELGYGAGLVGLVFMLSSIGALLGAVVSERTTRRFGLGAVIVWPIAIGGLAMFLLPIAPRDAAFPFFVAGFFAYSLTGVVYNVNQVTLRQAITPHRLQGRMNAAMRFMVWGTIPIGALLGGFLGTVLGPRATLLIGAVGGMLALGWVFFSPVRSLQAIPPSEGDATTPSEAEAAH